MRARFAILTAVVLALTTLPSLPQSPPENILIIIADDMGVDMLSKYGLGTNLPSTPNIDALADAGVVFRSAYANPVCMPTRASLQSGRHGFRTGVLTNGFASALPSSEATLAEVLPSSYATAMFGKWHLGDNLGNPSALAQGYDH